MTEEEFRELLTKVVEELPFQKNYGYYGVQTPKEGVYAMVIAVNGRPKQLVNFAEEISWTLEMAEKEAKDVHSS